MEQTEELRRMEDLAERCERTGAVTCTGFLTPAESYALQQWLGPRPELRCILTGGIEGCERRAGFFLPWYREDFSPEEHLRAVKLQGCFGTPGHRDYLGAILALGIRREWIGDILMDGDCAYVFCLPSVEPTLLELDRAGRITVKATPVPLSEVPQIEKKVKELSFTVKSMRLDAVTGELFGLSRTKAAELIRLGAVSLNYAECLKPDAEIKEGDVLSVKGKGKGQILETGGRSKKDRLFLRAQRYL